MSCAVQQPLSLADARAALQREAVTGVCHTGRYRCPYLVWGDGPPLLFIHGLADSAQAFLLPLARLKEHFRCIAYDLPVGRGDGARLTHYQHEDLAADALALLDHLGCPQSYVFGSSFGSTIVLRLLHEAPARFPRALLQGGFAQRPLAPAELLLALLARSWPGTLRQLPGRKLIMQHVHRSSFEHSPAEMWDYFCRQTDEQRIAAVASRAVLLHRVDLRPLLPSIRQPVLLLCGERDPLVKRPCEQVLLRGLPNAARAEIAGCGHLPYYTHPEIVAELVHRFLTPLPCNTASCTDT